MASYAITTPGAPTDRELPAGASPVSALELARRIEIPRRLPPTYKGSRLKVLSDSSISKFLTCPDDWRRHYLLGERGPASGSMFLGNRIDHVLTTYYQSLIAGGGPLNLSQLREAFQEDWTRALTEEAGRYGPVRWDEGTTERSTFKVGLDAVEVSLKRLVPQLGVPLYAQRSFEFRIAPASDVEWTVVGRVDLDTIREQRVFLTEDGRELAVQEPGRGEPTIDIPWARAPKDLRPPLTKKHERDSDAQAAEYQADVAVPASRLAGEIVLRQVIGVTDYKAKNLAIYEYHAARESQPTLYLCERACIEHDPVWDFTYAQVLKPKAGRRMKVSATVVRTRRAQYQLDAFLARIADVAARIDALYRTRGAHKPWGFAPFGSWKCEPNAAGSDGKYCPHWRTCPAGIGLKAAA